MSSRGAAVVRFSVFSTYERCSSALENTQQGGDVIGWYHSLYNRGGCCRAILYFCEDGVVDFAQGFYQHTLVEIFPSRS